MIEGLNIGTYIRVKTKTLEDKFGTCVYKIEGPEEEAELGGQKIIKVKCVMLGGSGPAARSGIPVWDTWEILEQNIKNGITEIISEEEAKKAEAHYASQKDAFDKQHSGTGAFEIDV